MSATPQELKQRIEANIPGAQAEVTGDGHHF
ncbi:MAG: BolA family transcriptional regulator, partial [Solirubrobacterales bacterium]|nr:BolA family transcriptional regulator [Solirubrobacterales bacterium]